MKCACRVIVNDVKKRGKAMPVTGRGGPLDLETSRIPHFLGTRFTGGDEGMNITRRPPFPPGRFLALFSLRGRDNLKAILWLEGLGQLKKQMTSRI
jgi:hypothetical protein